MGNMASSASPWGKISRKRESKFDIKREAVLRSAAALFRERGYEGASLNDLAEILNITKPTIYYYVQSKEQLLLDILTVAQEEILGFMRRADAKPQTGYEKLREIMIDYAQIIVSDYGACLSRIWTKSIDPASFAPVESRIREADQILYKVLEEGVNDGSLIVTDRTVVMHALFGSLNWMAYWAKPTRRLSPLKLAETQVDILLRGVSAAPRSTTVKPFQAAKPARAPKADAKGPTASASGRKRKSAT